MQLDVESSFLQSDPISDESMKNRRICLMLNKTTSEVLHLEAKPRGREDRCIQPKLVDHRGLCQSSVVPDSSLPVTGKTTDGEDGSNHTTMEYPAIFSNLPGPIRGLFMSSPSNSRPVNPHNRSGIYHETESSGTNCVTHLRESFTSQGTPLILLETNNLV